MNINELRTEFNKYDLDLIEKELPVSVLIIKKCPDISIKQE
jgi:hypothetical protein